MSIAGNLLRYSGAYTKMLSFFDIVTFTLYIIVVKKICQSNPYGTTKKVQGKNKEK